MASEEQNVWDGILEDKTVETTSNVVIYLEKIASELKAATHDKVEATFCRVKDELLFSGIADLAATANSAQEMLYRRDGRKDANALYATNYYIFNIQNASYKFRLFAIDIPPVFPVELIIDEGVYSDVSGSLTSCGSVDDKEHTVTVGSQEKLERVFPVLLQSKKLKYLVNTLSSME